MLYMNLRVTTHQKPVTDTQKIKEMEYKPSNHKGKEQEKKGIEKNYKNNHKTTNVNKYIPVNN